MRILSSEHLSFSPLFSTSTSSRIFVGLGRSWKTFPPSQQPAPIAPPLRRNSSTALVSPLSTRVDYRLAQVSGVSRVRTVVRFIPSVQAIPLPNPSSHPGDCFVRPRAVFLIFQEFSSPPSVLVRDWIWRGVRHTHAQRRFGRLTAVDICVTG